MNRRRPAALTLLLVLGTLALHSRGRAQAGAGLRDGLRVEPSADGCVTQATLEPRVRRWLDAQAPRSDMTITVHAASDPPAFSVLRDGRVIAERSFDVLPAACSDRLDAIAVAVAIAIEHATSAGGNGDGPGRHARDAAAARARVGERPSGEVEPADAPAVTPDAETATKRDGDATPANDRAREVDDGERAAEQADDAAHGDEATDERASAASGWRLFAGAGLLFEVLPDTAFTLDAGVEVQASALVRIDAAALFTLEREDALAGGRAHSQLLAARALACLSTRLAGGELDLAGCGGGAGGVVLASGDGFDQNDAVTLGWAAVVMRAAVRYPASTAISLRFALDGLLNAVRPELAVVGPPAATTIAGPVSAAGSVELVIALP
jgi:hypothetical protein